MIARRLSESGRVCRSGIIVTMERKLGVRAVLVQSAVQATAGVLALAMMAPFFGPLLDHHFAERFPHHGHIYVTSGEPDHLHAYAVPHHHHDDGHSHVHAGGAEPGEAAAPAGGILFFVSNDGVTQAPMSIVVPPVTHDLTPPVPEDRGSPFPPPGDDAPMAGIAVPPPDEPPRG